jgi:peptidoglycan hydrolase-like protein with peptidoglycan-binding domain
MLTATHQPAIYKPATYQPATHQPATHQPATHQPAIYKPIVKRGSQGAAVVELQQRLNGLNDQIAAQLSAQTAARFAHLRLDEFRSAPPLHLDGDFGPLTERALKAAQKRYFLPMDGVAGLPTWRSVVVGMPIGMPLLSLGRMGREVRLLQDRLAHNCYPTGAIDGDFGPQTVLAVRRLQQDLGLRVDGKVAAETWNAIAAQLIHI